MYLQVGQGFTGWLREASMSLHGAFWDWRCTYVLPAGAGLVVRDG